MAIQKKSLIAALKTVKTANAAGARPESDATKVMSTKFASTRASQRSMRSLKQGSLKQLSQKASAKASFKASARAATKSSLRSAH